MDALPSLVRCMREKIASKLHELVLCHCFLTGHGGKSSVVMNIILLCNFFSLEAVSLLLGLLQKVSSFCQGSLSNTPPAELTH